MGRGIYLMTWSIRVKEINFPDGPPGLSHWLIQPVRNARQRCGLFFSLIAMTISLIALATTAGGTLRNVPSIQMFLTFIGTVIDFILLTILNMINVSVW